MQISSVMMSYCLQLKIGKYWINDISGNIKAVFLKLGTINVHQKRNKVTPLVLLLSHWCCVNKNCNSRFCFKTRTNYPNQSNDGTKDNMGTISVPSRTLCPTVEVANGDFFAFWQKETGAKTVAMETARVSFCFFCDVHLWCQVSRTLLQYFQRYCLFSIFHILVANNMTSSLNLICIIENVDISKSKKDISKRKTPFFCILQGLSNKHKLFFTS